MIDARYVAGFFDGEGSIGIYVYNKIGLYRLITQLNQNYSPYVEKFYVELTSQFGGHFNMGKTFSGKYNLNWQLYAHKAVNFLEYILPYLKFKREQAQVGIFWQKDRKLAIRDKKGILRSINDKSKDAQFSKLIALLKTSSIDEVMNNQKDLVEVVTELKQILCVKG